MPSQLSPQLIEWAIHHRRYLHQYPELSGQEYATCQYIKDCLQELGISILDFSPPSVVGYLQGTKGDKTIALRADIDALPIMEEGDKSYLSKHPGVAHVCGHDGHTAILLAAAKWLTEHRQEVEANVLFIFQSSEEMLPSGAEALVKQGVLEGVDAVFGLHLWQPLAKGKIGISYGPMMASADDFTVTIMGKGGHGSMPHETIDPTYIASHLIGAFQGIVTRKVNALQPAVISVGKLEAGSTYNIIPDTATMCGTVRTYSPEVREYLAQELEKVTTGICASFGARASFEYGWGTPAIINDAEMSGYVEQVVTSHFGPDVVTHVEPVMGGEDFSYYLQQKRGAYIFVGMNGEKSAYPHHHPRFDIDEEVMPTAIQLFIHLVKNFD